MSKAWAGGSTRRWRVQRARILARDGNDCQLRIPGICLGIADQGHHVLGKGVSERDEDIVAACLPCNVRVGKPDTDPSHKVTTW